MITCPGNGNEEKNDPQVTFGENNILEISNKDRSRWAGHARRTTTDSAGTDLNWERLRMRW